MTPPSNPTLTRALGGLQPNRRVPTLLELLAPSMHLRLVPRAVNQYGWQHYTTKLERDAER